MKKCLIQKTLFIEESWKKFYVWNNKHLLCKSSLNKIGKN